MSALTRQDIEDSLPNVDEDTIDLVMALGPSDRDLQQALSWLRGEPSGEMGTTPSSMRAAQVYTILLNLRDDTAEVVRLIDG